MWIYDTLSSIYIHIEKPVWVCIWRWCLARIYFNFNGSNFIRCHQTGFHEKQWMISFRSSNIIHESLNGNKIERQRLCLNCLTANNVSAFWLTFYNIIFWNGISADKRQEFSPEMLSSGNWRVFFLYAIEYDKNERKNGINSCTYFHFMLYFGDKQWAKWVLHKWPIEKVGNSHSNMYNNNRTSQRIQDKRNKMQRLNQ